jgi:hypothetical protein
MVRDMRRMIDRVLVIGLLLVGAGHGSPAAAQETRTMKAGAQAPPARLEDLAWLQGAWEGPGISGPATEVYSGPAGGQIVGHFRQLRGDGIWFYEIMTIVQAGASLEYRLKHFNHDLTGWEEKTQVVTFPLVAIEKEAWYFDGLTIRRDGPDGMVGAVRIDSKDGPPREAVFRYRRVK